MLFVSIVMDGVGIGAQPDADQYGDKGTHTLGHVCEAAKPDLPQFADLGLGCIDALPGIPCPEHARAHYGKMQEVSAGKDSTTGHWELAGLRLTDPFPTYPDGFPPEVIDAFIKKTGVEGVLGNRPASGTTIIAELGPEHETSGHPIIYTSADSVFQIAAHKNVIPLEELYRLCRVAREEVCVGPHGVGRVIARPFVGSAGNYTRISAERKDLALLPDRTPLQQVLQNHGVRTISVGKISDLFGHVGFDEQVKTKSNAEGIAATKEAMQEAIAEDTPTFVWTNLIDFDQEYGHRNDPEGFAAALEELDRHLPELVEILPGNGVLLITADHGNDPTGPGTDHTREFVPLLALEGARPTGPGQNLGLRPSFNDHAATVAAYFDVPFDTAGTSFL